MTPRPNGIAAEAVDEDHVRLSPGIPTAADLVQSAQGLRSSRKENLSTISPALELLVYAGRPALVA
jgi:hypothetical protein